MEKQTTIIQHYSNNKHNNKLNKDDQQYIYTAKIRYSVDLTKNNIQYSNNLIVTTLY